MSSASRLIGIVFLCSAVACVPEPLPEQEAPPVEAFMSVSGLTQDHVLPTGAACVATGAHNIGAHAPCAKCHPCGGELQFSARPEDGIVIPGAPLPTFNAAETGPGAKTCSNIGCHRVPAGVFTYYFQGGDGEPELKSAPYGSDAASTPNWYSSGLGCGACHGNPPFVPGTSTRYPWHSGMHGSSTGGATNACSLCHPSAVGEFNGSVSTAAFNTANNCGPARNESCRAFHGNGTVDVTARFNSTCNGCH